MKKLLSIILSLTIFTSLLPIISVTVSASEFSGGDGSIENPYQISTAEQLNAVRNNLSANYIQVADIDLSIYNNWIPIGEGTGGVLYTPGISENPKPYSNPFDGSFNGNGFTISNMIIKDAQTYGIGLFGSISEKSKIQNINLRNCNINIEIDDNNKLYKNGGVTYYLNVGGIVGKASSEISNCSVSGSIQIKNCNMAQIGGIVGVGNAERCVNKANIAVNGVSDLTIGGIIGYCANRKEYISFNINYGNIEAIGENFVKCGGICGEDANVNNCINYGNLFSKSNGATGYNDYYKNSNVGGIEGVITEETIENCINYGNIVSSAYYPTNHWRCGKSTASGICGDGGYFGGGKIKACYNASTNISSTNYTDDDEQDGDAGRISDNSPSLIENCYSVSNTVLNGNIVLNNIGTDKKDGENIDKSIIDIKANEIIRSIPLAYAQIPSDWAEYEINQAIMLGLIPEELQSDYRAPITRLDFCKLAFTLYEKIKGKMTLTSDNFTDTKTLSKEDINTIGSVSLFGIVNGYDDGAFKPYKEISRQEAAVMLMRTAKVLGLGEFIDNNANVYDDCGDVADWAMEGIKYVCNASIMNGSNSWIETNPDGYTTKANHITFSPYDNYTREQAMITYYRLYNKLKISDNSSNTTDASGNSSTQKTDYSAAYQNYIDAIYNYKKALETATSNEGIASDLEKSRISAMKEYWIIAPKNNIPDEVYLCLYEFTSDLGELKVSSKNVDWATLKGQLEGCIDIPTSIAGSIASNDVTYSYNGVDVSFSGGLTLGKVGANIIIEWKNSGFRTLTSNPNVVLSTYKNFNDQCLDLADDMINDEYREIAEILTGYTGVSDFLTKKISGSLNRLAKKSGLGDINDFLGECYEMYELTSFFQGKDNPEELVEQMQKLSTKDLLSDTTITNVAVKTAMNEVNKAKEKLIEAAYDYVYGK